MNREVGRWISAGAIVSHGLQAVRKERWAYTHHSVLCQSKMDRAFLTIPISQRCPGPEQDVAPTSKFQLLFTDHTLGQFEIEGGKVLVIHRMTTTLPLRWHFPSVFQRSHGFPFQKDHKHMLTYKYSDDNSKGFINAPQPTLGLHSQLPQVKLACPDLSFSQCI